MAFGELRTATAGMPVAEAARRYAAAGAPVFPLVPGGKRPLTEHGFHDASTDPRQIAAWWSKWPGANLGVPTGAAGGIDVVDVDVHPSGSGFSAFERARRAGLVDGWAVLVRTPSGGLHAYYPADPGRPQPSWQAAKAHVDFRGAGGYIVAPPSTVATGQGRRPYHVVAVAAGESAAVDAAALREFLDPRPVPAARSWSGRELDAGRLAGWVAARGEGERNRGLFWASCRLAEAGLSAAEAHTVLGAAAEYTGLPTPEIAATIRSAYRTATATALPVTAPRSAAQDDALATRPDRLVRAAL